MKPYNERCWINGYEWGVEYETNGEKPDLPDGVLVEYKSKWVGWVRYGDGYDAVENWVWENSTAFKIYDERYKPLAERQKDAVRIAKYIVESHKPKENTMNNDWYSKGELPPVGAVVRHKKSGKDVEVKCHLRTGQIIGERLITPIIEIGFASDFEPIRTETDKLVEQMMFHGCQSLTKKQATELVEQGYRKVKPMNKDEFVQSARKYFECFDSLRFDVGKMRLICESLRKLHSAGCRFIDQGE